MPYAFLSYQTDDKLVAGQIKSVLSKVGIDAFMAHEDIAVSEEWRLKILDEIGKADIFICLLSKSYLNSIWCIQESGIASFRKDMTVIPLSLDGTIPQGFVGNVQSAKIDPVRVYLGDLIPGFLKHNLSLGLDIAIEQVAHSASFRGAEANFQLLLPHLPRMTDEHIKRLLEVAANNDQVHHASLCASKYIPPLLASHGHLLAPETQAFLTKTCALYAGSQETPPK